MADFKNKILNFLVFWFFDLRSITYIEVLKINTNQILMKVLFSESTFICESIGIFFMILIE